MKHRYSLEGYGYRLRPVRLADAPFIVAVRREDMERSRFLHTVSEDPAEQETWLNHYFEREGDFYFVIENRLTGQPEGLISFYNARDGRAEWGRWVLKKASLAAAESVYLLYRIAFEQAGMRELYCRTIADNAAVVSFHTSIGELTRTVHTGMFELDGRLYDAVEQYSDKANFYGTIAPRLEAQSEKILRRCVRQRMKGMEFHHIGIAARRIEKELPLYRLLGYEKEGGPFEDDAQGVRGVFLAAEGQPRLELLENLPGRHTLDTPLRQNQKLYHTAYCVKDIEAAVDLFTRNRAKILSPLKESAYFGKRICFLMLPNMMMLELVEV